MKYHNGCDSEVFPPCCKLVIFLPVRLGGGSSRKTKKTRPAQMGKLSVFMKPKITAQTERVGQPR